MSPPPQLYHASVRDQGGVPLLSIIATLDVVLAALASTLPILGPHDSGAPPPTIEFGRYV